MKNKKLAILSILILYFVILFMLINSLKNGTINEEKIRAFRSKQSILSEKVIYLDEESIALSDSNTDSSLRSQALTAYNLVNELRQENGIKELEWDDNLEGVSNVRSKEISLEFSHTRPNGKPWYTINSTIQAGENLAYGFDNAEDVINAWENSPTHLENLLYEDFNSMAISIYEENGIYYWGQEFGY